MLQTLTLATWLHGMLPSCLHGVCPSQLSVLEISGQKVWWESLAQGKVVLCAAVHTQSLAIPSSSATGTEVTQVLVITERAQPIWCWGGMVLGALPAEESRHSSPVAFTRHISQRRGPDLLPSMLPSPAAEHTEALACRLDHFNLRPHAALPPSAQPAGLLGPLAELCLVQALYLFSFSMHTSGALYRYKIIKMTVPR